MCHQSIVTAPLDGWVEAAVLAGGVLAVVLGLVLAPLEHAAVRSATNPTRVVTRR
jgi:hypothetical protein